MITFKRKNRRQVFQTESLIKGFLGARVMAAARRGGQAAAANARALPTLGGDQLAPSVAQPPTWALAFVRAAARKGKAAVELGQGSGGKGARHVLRPPGIDQAPSFLPAAHLFCLSTHACVFPLADERSGRKCTPKGTPA